jgi:hemerythrin superfamily protein
MTIHELFQDEHKVIRKMADQLRGLMAKEPAKLPDFLPRLQKEINRHFKREEVYYRVLDDGKRIGDRELMHSLRNDHAGVVFTLESLSIRLRKGGFSPDWQKRCETMLGVLLPHLDHEEKDLFPKGVTFLSPDDLRKIFDQAQEIE